MNGIGHHCIPSPTFNGYDVSSVNQKNVIATRYCITKSMITSDPEKFSGSPSYQQSLGIYQWCQFNNYSFLLYAGLLIFLSFALSGKALELYRVKFTDIWRYLTARKDANPTANDPVPYTCDTFSVDIAQDTRL